MPVVPILRPYEVVRTFEKLGWEVTRQRGSHIIMTKEGLLATLSIPNHPEVARGTLRSLITRAGITVEEFREALKR
jgi:predicted RNA binding protein YcfA (HicA-like mRNA interferase family)